MASWTFQGTYTALVTPFVAGGQSIDFEALERLVEDQIAGGVSGLVPCGTTGETPTLTASERAATKAASRAQREQGKRAAAEEREGARAASLPPAQLEDFCHDGFNRSLDEAYQEATAGGASACCAAACGGCGGAGCEARPGGAGGSSASHRPRTVASPR